MSRHFINFRFDRGMLVFLLCMREFAVYKNEKILLLEHGTLLFSFEVTRFDGQWNADRII